MPKRKEPERSREEQERIFKQAAREHGADESGKSFSDAIKKIVMATNKKRTKLK